MRNLYNQAINRFLAPLGMTISVVCAQSVQFGNQIAYTGLSEYVFPCREGNDELRQEGASLQSVQL